ncbi:hypothetical protein ACQUFY_10860 [Robbsia andropogonis]|uniref:hypothetical protein n=1 Tax=Robbsia andropogonis TaxID=28092 RepID=UPI003D1A9997
MSKYIASESEEHRLIVDREPHGSVLEEIVVPDSGWAADDYADACARCETRGFEYLAGHGWFRVKTNP